MAGLPLDLPFLDNPLLFGHGRTPAIVAVELAGEGSARIFTREKDTLSQTVRAFAPFMLVAEEELLRGLESVVPPDKTEEF